MNNFNFVLFIYLIILLQTKTSKTSYIFTGKHFLQRQFFRRCTVEPWLNKRIRLGFMGEQGAESIHAAVNAITRAYTSIPDKVSQVQCILHSLLLFYYFTAGAMQDTPPPPPPPPALYFEKHQKLNITIITRTSSNICHEWLVSKNFN